MEFVSIPVSSLLRPFLQSAIVIYLIKREAGHALCQGVRFAG